MSSSGFDMTRAIAWHHDIMPNRMPFHHCLCNILIEREKESSGKAPFSCVALCKQVSKFLHCTALYYTVRLDHTIGLHPSKCTSV